MTLWYQGRVPLSLSEICASSTAPILVPYPHAAANHQRINAKCLLDMGACVYIEDKELDPNKLREAILELLDNPVKNELSLNRTRLILLGLMQLKE